MPALLDPLPLVKASFDPDDRAAWKCGLIAIWTRVGPGGKLGMGESGPWGGL